MSTNIRNNADNSLGITTDGSGQLSLIPNANYAAPITLSNASITTSATSMLVTNGNPLQPPGNNLLSPDTTIGFSLGTSTGRDQTYVNGFYMNQDGDVLTPTNKTRYVFTYTGGDQSFTVPANVTWIYVKLWGAGGGAGRQGGWVYGADGGGGGHTRGLIPVTPGATIYVKVGSGGTTVNGTTAQYGGGGVGSDNADNQYGGQGGGFCGVFNGSVAFANALAIAGGGGGGGSSRAWTGNIGGAGGGITGMRGCSPYDGKFSMSGGPGTANAGGGGGSGASQNGGAGSALQGGVGAVNTYGGGGGGGYYGGGGGAYSESNTMAGGGGGSGYVIGTSVLGYTYAGAYRQPPFSWDPDLMVGYTGASIAEMPGYGGLNMQNQLGSGVVSGGHAVAVIYY